MSQVRIYGNREALATRREAISDAIHAGLMDALGLPETKRFQRFFPLEPEDFIHPGDRSDAYTIIEISMFAGRSSETKRRLIRLLFERLKGIGIAPKDVEITIFESPAADWGIRGRPGDELALDYDVNV
jgi:phenylpyruvate tautomerase PptA (4-oxalocrotonate tautomerase family)